MSLMARIKQGRGMIGFAWGVASESRILNMGGHL